LNILITGGTGSFGNALVRRLLPLNPNRLVVYSRDEQKQEDMARRFSALGVDHRCLRFFIGDVRDRDRLEFAMRDIGTVIHAAALKIVPTAEYNPTECIATNIGGSENVVWASMRAGVRRVLALSTDKAVNPINLYGASKLAAEKVFVAANWLSAGACRFSIMRYGNVVGSRGSVIPLFNAQVAERKPLTITDGRMTRFWITLENSVQFTLDCLDKMEGREIFVPKLPSMKIADLALSMAKEAGIGTRITGIRPGEKLHETLITEDEARSTVDCDGFYIIKPHSYTFTQRDAKVPDGFRYQSDTNGLWIKGDEIQAYLREIEKHEQALRSNKTATAA
jgi:UDP-N-acetylglucosamine 4,6-dehydratase